MRNNSKEEFTMNLYADSIIDELRGANNKCMQDYKNLLKKSMEARSAIFKFSTERKIPIIVDYDGCRNYSVLPPIKEERSEDVLQELLSTSESGSTYKGNIRILTVIPYGEEDLSDTYDDEYVSSEQEESCIEDYDIRYVPVGNTSIPQYQTEGFTSLSTSPKLEAKQGYTDLRYVLHGPNYYYEGPVNAHAEYEDRDFYQYDPTQQFYDGYDSRLHEREDDRLYYDDLHNQQFTSYPKYVYEQPHIYAPQKCFYKKKPRHTYYEIPHENVIKNNTRQYNEPRRCEPTYSKQYYVQAPPGHANHHSRTYFTPKYTTYYEKKPQYYYESNSYLPRYTTYPNEAYFGYSDYPQFQKSEDFGDPFENYEYTTYY